jgi:carbamoyl-phosphate synthase large subunit
MNLPVVAVTGINAVDNPGPGIAVARCLRQAGAARRVLGLAYDAMEPGVFLDWIVDASFLMPYPSGDPRAFIDRLLEIRDRHGLDVIIPSLDAELPVFIHHAAELASHGIATLLPTAAQFRLRAKDRLDEVARASGMRLPPTVAVTDPGGLHAAVARLGLPAFVKGCFYEATKVATHGQALEAYHRLVIDWGVPVLVQSPVEGEHLNVAGVGDGRGGDLGLVAVKKLATTKEGKMWTGVTVRHGALLECTRRFVAATKWRGPFEVECIVRGDEVTLIEINPRFPSWIYLSAGVGVNLPARLLASLRGEALEPAIEAPAGQLFVRYSMELTAPMTAVADLMATGEHR